MKNLALVSIAIIINIATYAQEIVTNGEISDVIVYLQGASITTKSKTQIPEGVSTVVITKQPQSIEPQSIQVSGKGNFTILGVQFRTNYLEKQQQEKQVLELSEKRKLIDNTLKLVTEEINVYKTETQLLEKNMEIKGANAVLVTSELEKTANFYRSRLLDIKKKIIEAQNKQTDLQTQLKDIDKQLFEIKAKAEQYIGEIVVTVSSKTQQTIQLESNYYVNDAGWVPQYDIRVKDVQSPVALTYKASIYQNTGISWKNIQVRLSTGNPTLSGNVPILSPWILQREIEIVRAGYSYAPKAMALYEESLGNDVTSAVVEKAKKTTATVNNKLTTIEFAIQELISLQSGEKEAIVTIQEYAIPASYTYVSIPKLNKSAFLLVYIKGYEGYSLLSGNANIFFEGSFVGQSYFETENTQDSLQISLGRDKGIQIERNRIQDFSEKKMMGQKRKQLFSYEIIVRNTKLITVPIIIQDQIPISGQQEINVSSVSHPEGTLDSKTGTVTWKFNLDKSITKKLQISYMVEYPKDWKIEGLSR